VTAVYSHIAVKPIGRSAGAGVVGRAAYQSGTRGIIASAAYRAGERLTEQSTDHIFDYTNKRGIHTAYLMLPEDAPAWASDRQKLWNEADQVPGRKDARIATEIEFSLPKELSWAQRRELVDNLFRPLVERHHIAVDIALHTGADPRNVHCHAITSHRELGPDGFGDIACRHTIIRKVKGQQRDVEVAGITAMPSDVERLRRLLDKHTNDAFRRAGLDLTVDSRSYERQGNGLTPTLPLGPERKGDTEREQRAEYNNRVMAERAERERQALDQAVEVRHQEPQRVEVIAKVQNLPRDRQHQAAKAYWQRTAEAGREAQQVRDEVFVQRGGEQGRQADAQERQKHAAAIEPRRPAISREERAQLERDARLDRMDSGDVATPADIARQISPAYAHEEARLEAVNQQLDRTTWNRGQLDQEAQASLARIDERREKMTWWETIKNIARTDPELAHWRDVHDRSVIGYKQATRKERVLEKEQAKATRDANKAYASVKPDAVAELNRRHAIANDAREKLRVLDAGERAIEKQPIDRAAEREQRATDFYERKIIAGRDLRRQAREERLARGDDFWQQTLAAGRMANTAKANAMTYEDIRQINETAKLDRDKWGYHPLTVEDVAREISPAFADADDCFKALTTKADTLDKAIEDKAREQQGVKWHHDLRQEQMSGLQAVADRFWRDQQLFDLEETWHKLDKERTELVEHRTRLTDKLGAAEDTRAAELEKVREPAQRELADRQQRAAAARETLAAYRARERAIEQERQAERQRLQPSRGYSLGR
jgi:MobA/MobL family